MFLSAKVCENPRKYRDVLSCCDCAQKFLISPNETNPALIDLSTYKFIDLKETLMENERLILKELGFSVYKLLKDNAHKWLVAILQDIFQIQ